jgi:hypothetical protein
MTKERFEDSPRESRHDGLVTPFLNRISHFARSLVG